MPKQVDHQQRRRQIAAAVVHLARERGLQGVTFREVAAEAGMSVALIQHYFGSKENLLIGTIDIESGRLGRLIEMRLERLGREASPLSRLRVVAGSFLATDPDSREAMLLYHSFGGAALTDAALRRADAFSNAQNLMVVLSTLVEAAQQARQIAVEADPQLEAWALIALVLGLSMSVLLEQLPPDQAEAVLDAYLKRLAPRESRPCARTFRNGPDE